MGEVYRARDPRIGRDVALKVLPPGFAGDPDRLRRFEHESRAAGMLNHPNLLAVFDVGTDNGAPYIVSELLEGETLRTRLDDGAVPLRKAIDYARQVAAGLAAAHEKGIVHRDLKPENIFITRDGQVKILDFGLAKSSNTTSAPHLSAGATVERNTDPGTVLGTVGYMSPEQVRALNVDHRSDIFSLGSILYEMLTGRRAFKGDSSADTMSAILREDPPEISTSNANIPPGLERIVRHCLEKDVEQRFQSARDLAFDLDSLSGSGTQAVAPSLRRIPNFLPLAMLLAGVSAGVAFMRWRQPPAPLPPLLRLLTYSGRDLYPAVSPDGRSIAFTSARDGRSRIWLKDLASSGEIPLTEGEDILPRFSPDGTSILFLRKEGAMQSLWRNAVVGGTPRRLVADVTSADWSNDGRRIIFTRNVAETSPETALMTSAADGSGVQKLRTLPRRYQFPRYSPDGTRIAITDVTPGATIGIVMILAADGKPAREIEAHRTANAGLSSTSWLDNRRLLYMAPRAATTPATQAMQIVRVDVETGIESPLLQTLAPIQTVEIAGDDRLVFDSITQRQNLREILLTRGAPPTGRWITRGNGIDRQPAYSPDGTRVVFSSNRTGNLDIWTVSMKDGSLARITDDEADDYDPAFTRDGKHLIWSSNRGGHFEIWIAADDGSGARQVSRDGVDAENATATGDGQWLVYCSYNPQKLGIWKVPVDGSAATQVVKGSVELPEVSPDGEYVSYHVLAPRSELHVVRLRDGRVFKMADMRGLSNQVVGAGRSRWTADGKSIAWTDLDVKNTWGVFVQQFIPGADTSATRRIVAGFDPDLFIESFGFSPDGRYVTVSVLEETDAIYRADRVAGIKRPGKR